MISTGHAAAQLTPALIERAALVLTATSKHRADVLRGQPAAMRRAYTLPEFARLGAGVAYDPDRPLPETVMQVPRSAAVRGAPLRPVGVVVVLLVVAPGGTAADDVEYAAVRTLCGSRKR